MGLSVPPEQKPAQRPLFFGRRGPFIRRHPAERGSWWWTASTGGMALILGIGTLILIWLFARPLALLILGASLASAVAPFVDWLSVRLPRTLAIVLVYLAILLAAVGVFAIIIPPMASQVGALIARAPKLIQDYQNFVNQSPIFSNAGIRNAIWGGIGGLASGWVSAPLNLASTMIDLLLAVVISAYWLAVAPGMRSFFLSLFPAQLSGRFNHIIEELGIGMGGYIRGTFINGLILGAAAYIGLLIIGVNYPIVLGTFAGLMELIPYVGPFVSGAAMVGVALSQSATQGLVVLIFAIALQEIEGHLLVPIVMRTQTDISPLLAVIALFAGYSVGGLIGALTAIPLAVAIRVIIRRAIAPAIRRQTGAAEPGEGD